MSDADYEMRNEKINPHPDTDIKKTAQPKLNTSTYTIASYSRTRPSKSTAVKNEIRTSAHNTNTYVKCLGHEIQPLPSLW